jgi:ribosomal 30S subunit maturation factor RimM
VYVIETDGGDILIPAVKAFVEKIDLSQRIIIIDPVEGLLGRHED